MSKTEKQIATRKLIALRLAKKRIDAWLWLSELPAFRTIQPLSDGIDRQIYAMPDRPSKNQLKKLLYHYRHSEAYCAKVIAGMTPVDIYGRPVKG